jgi:hypothetical protein
MDGYGFDKLTRNLATGTSRRRLLQGSGAGLAVGLLALAGVRTEAAGRHGRHKKLGTQGATCRTIGGACQSDASCCPNQHLVCTQVGSTGARRCECDQQGGFQECNGTCQSIQCPSGQPRQADCTCGCSGGQEACTTGGVTACYASCSGGQVRQADCSCDCPTGTVKCDNGNCVSSTCPGGQAVNTTTCSCGCPQGQIFCGGTCHNESTECRRNQTINVNCCNQGYPACQNPGQINTCHGTQTV